MKKQQRILKTLRNAVVLALVFVLSTEPILVAAQPQPENLRAQAVDLALQGGDRYLDSASKAVVESAELLGYLNVIQATPIDQISESYISDVITRALSVAEQSSIALGAVDDVADGVEQLGGTFPAAIDIATEATVPEEMRADLIALGIPAEQVDQISAGASSLYSSRQAGMSAQVQADLLSFGFTQTQIDEIAIAVNQHGLVNPALDTRMAQFRSTQDELADTRSGMLTLAVQMLGYQIAIRQANGIAARDVTEAELQELAQDELRLLVHAAHLNAMWGNDPDTEIGEGDWWFIEHYAGRAGERLQNLIVETQNRGLVAELFVIHQMKMLAVSARTGDAEYAKAELDSLAGLLASRLNTTAYYEQRLSAGLVERLWSQLTTAEAVRGRMEWVVPQSVAKNAVLVSMERLNATGVENLAVVYGQFDETNEVNNTNGVLIVAGLPFWNQASADVLQVLQRFKSFFVSDAAYQWLIAILSGDTNDPALLVANVILGFIPAINVLVDLATLVYAHSTLLKAVGIFALICDIGSTLAFIGIQFEVVGLAWLGKATAEVMGGLARKSAALIKAYQDMKLVQAVESVIEVIRALLHMLWDNILGHSLVEVISKLDNLFKGALQIWDDYVAFAVRADAKLIVELGISEGSFLTGRIVRNGISLSDEAFKSVKYIADDLIEAGVKLSNDGAKGLGYAANIFAKTELENFVHALKNCSDCNIAKFEAALETLGRHGDTPALRSFATKVNGADVAEILKRFQTEPAEFKLIIDNLGPFVNKDAITAALIAGREAGVGGPEALRAIAGWGAAPGDLLKSDTIAKELALRAGTDAKAIRKLNEIVSLTPLQLEHLDQEPAKSLIEELASLSIQEGGNSFFVLGVFNRDLGLKGGYAKIARELKAVYFYPYLETWDRLSALVAKRQVVWEAIDWTAMRIGGRRGADFKYTFFDAPPQDSEALEKLFLLQKDGELLEGIVDDELAIIYKDFPNIPPDRMKEIKILLFEYNYKISIDSLGSYILSPR